MHIVSVSAPVAAHVVYDWGSNAFDINDVWSSRNDDQCAVDHAIGDVIGEFSPNRRAQAEPRPEARKPRPALQPHISPL